MQSHGKPRSSIWAEAAAKFAYHGSRSRSRMSKNFFSTKRFSIRMMTQDLRDQVLVVIESTVAEGLEL